jgi:hypothetical protein
MQHEQFQCHREEGSNKMEMNMKEVGELALEM